jgi:hypothetical protein
LVIICSNHFEWNRFVVFLLQSVIQISCCFNVEQWLNKDWYIVGIPAAVPARQKATPSIRRENDPNVDPASIYPITVSSASKSTTVGASNYPSTRDHEQEQHDYNQQGSSIILCHTFSPNLKYIELSLSVYKCACVSYILNILNSNWFLFYFWLQIWT